MSGGGKGDNKGNRRRPFNRRDRAQAAQSETRAKNADPRWGAELGRDKTPAENDRPRWTAPKMSTEPIPVPDCPYCGKAIKDMALAISDKNSGAAIHFDCVIARISQSEKLEPGDTISYIGGGRFGIINQRNPANPQSFLIKKIFEWEIKENRAEWRQTISDHFSVT